MSKKNQLVPQFKDFDKLVEQIKQLVYQARQNLSQMAWRELINTYWETGRYIVEYEQKGNIKAEYGRHLMIQLSKSLSAQLGKGFSRTNLIYMRLFYTQYPNRETLSPKLTWSHYFELLKIKDELERSFYEQQIQLENWSIKEFKRQKRTSLFQRLALSKDAEGIMELAKKGQQVETEYDIIKNPVVLEFLNLPEKHLYTETQLEQALIDNLQDFMLELGRGFCFVGRQYRITLNNRHFYPDLVFYNRILRCFVIIDLKRDEVSHEDIGQMNMYLNYFATEQNIEGDGEPIGIILSTGKDDVMVEYALGNMSNKIFTPEYQLYLPDKETLKAKIETVLEMKKWKV